MIADYRTFQIIKICPLPIACCLLIIAGCSIISANGSIAPHHWHITGSFMLLYVTIIHCIHCLLYYKYS
jgi:hypothetical protein